MNDLAKTRAELVPELTRDLAARVIDNPLSLLPASWQPAVWSFWAKWSDLLRTQLSLASQLREWVVDKGLTLAEAQEAFRAVSAPECRARVQFPGQVLAELAVEVSRLVALRRRADRRREDRERAEESRLGADPAAVRELLASIGVGGK